MPTRIMRRTPASSEAASYGYRDFLQDVVQKVVADTAEGFRDPTSLSKEELLELALSGVGGGIAKLTGAPKAARGLMKMFSKQGLKYDAFTEPLPGYGYHQWTLYGEGPAKGATFGTKTTDLAEMEGKIADLMRKFSKESLTPESMKEIVAKGQQPRGLDFARTRRSLLAKDEYRYSSMIPKAPTEITIYRGIRGRKDISELRPGDWVTPDKQTALEHLEMGGQGGRIIEKRVSSRDIVWAGTKEHPTTMEEWWYAPRKRRK